MVNRPAGGARSERYEREPYDWYVDPEWVTEQLMARIDFGDDLIWDPSCGRGQILNVAKRRGHPTFGSDIVDRHPRHRFQRGNFLQITKGPRPHDRSLSIINNPPYSYQPDIAESFIRKALSMPIRRAAFVVPIAFLCSETRWRFFHEEFMPSHIAILSQRPSMPPGSTVDEFTKFSGGMGDYVWVIYTNGPDGHRWRTQTIWLRPDTI